MAAAQAAQDIDLHDNALRIGLPPWDCIMAFGQIRGVGLQNLHHAFAFVLVRWSVLARETRMHRNSLPIVQL